MFACDDTLRRALAHIDPVFYQADRIEVGRRLNGDRWITFVEIAASSRWSELSEDMRCLRTFLVEQGRDDLVRQYDAIGPLAPTDRIRAEKAERLKAWLHAVRSAPNRPRKCFEQALFKTLRTERFQKARQVTAQHLPFFVYFTDSFMAPAQIPLPDPAEWSAGPAKAPPLHFGASCLLKALGIPCGTLDRRHPAEQMPEFQARGAMLGRLLDEVWQQDPIRFTPALKNNTLILQHGGRGKKTGVAISERPLLWLISLYAVVLAMTGDRPDNTVLLLDKPGHTFPRAAQQKINLLINRLADKHQTIITTDKRTMIGKSDLARTRLLDLNGAPEKTRVRTGLTATDLRRGLPA